MFEAYVSRCGRLRDRETQSAKGFFDLRGDFRRECVEALRENANVLQKLIVENYGRDGDEKAGGGGEKRFGNTGCNRAEARGVGITQSRECIDDAPDGAEKADERRDGTGGREPGHAFFGASHFFSRRDLHVGGHGLKTFEFRRLRGARCVGYLGLELAVSRSINRSERGARRGESLWIGDTASRTKDAQEIVAFATNASEESQLLKNHAPGDDRKQKKNREDGARNPASILENASEVDENDCREQINDDFPQSNENFYDFKNRSTRIYVKQRKVNTVVASGNTARR
jgi:hypothetical protein